MHILDYCDLFQHLATALEGNSPVDFPVPECILFHSIPPDLYLICTRNDRGIHSIEFLMCTRLDRLDQLKQVQMIHRYTRRIYATHL